MRYFIGLRDLVVRVVHVENLDPEFERGGGDLVNLRTTASQKCESVPRRARI